MNTTHKVVRVSTRHGLGYCSICSRPALAIKQGGGKYVLRHVTEAEQLERAGKCVHGNVACNICHGGQDERECAFCDRCGRLQINCKCPVQKTCKFYTLADAE